MSHNERALDTVRFVELHVPSLPRRAVDVRVRGAAPRTRLLFLVQLVPLVLCATLLAPAAANADPQVSDLDRQIAELSRTFETVVEQHNAVAADLAASRTRAAETALRITELDHNLRSARARVDRIAVWAFQTGPNARISAILAAGSPRDFMARLRVIEDVTRSDQRQITTLTEGSRRLADENATLQRLLTEQERQEAKLSGLKAQVEKDLGALKVLRDQVGATSRGSFTTLDSGPVTAPLVSGAAGVAVQFAYAQMGKPYEWGAAGPGSYDCSGLTSAAWKAAGVLLPHNAARQYSAMPHISRDHLQPGDLVFYYAGIQHVAMFVGDNTVIHAPTAGQSVRLQALNHAPIIGFGRPG
jgi:cell wall-associated NlpC family hydrolase